jgi:Glycosyltransferase family 87
MPNKSVWFWPRIGSGIIIVGVLVSALLVLLCSGYWLGWDPTWRSLGVTPLQPHFFDMHALTDHAACTSKGFNAYALNPCDPRTTFNYPPVWLWLGYLGIDGSDSSWLSVLITVAALGVMITLLKGRSVGDGALASMAILSPSVMMGIERGNTDIFILALVGGTALIMPEQRPNRMPWAVALVGLAIVLKLYPIFCVALAVRFNRRTVLFAAGVATVALVYSAIILDYIPIIRHNTPTTFMLSYGYQVLFLGLDHLRAEAGQLNPIGLANTWVPIVLAILTLIVAAATALYNFRYGSLLCAVPDSVAGTAFRFGAGIYCGTFLLGTNFIYRLMFLLLCLPQLQDWGSTKFGDNDRTITIARVLYVAVLLALWSNGSPNGHSTFMFVPQLVDWLIFFGLTTILLINVLNSVTAHSASMHVRPL